MDKKEAKLKEIYAVLSQKKELPPFPEHIEERIEYAGCSVNLPAHEGVDDSVYGSLAVYREEILEMLRQYRTSHPDEKVIRMLREAAEADSALSEAAEEMIRMLLADHNIKTKGEESNAERCNS